MIFIVFHPIVCRRRQSPSATLPSLVDSQPCRLPSPTNPVNFHPLFTRNRSPKPTPCSRPSTVRCYLVPVFWTSSVAILATVVIIMPLRTECHRRRPLSSPTTSPSFSALHFPRAISADRSSNTLSTETFTGPDWPPIAVIVVNFAPNSSRSQALLPSPTTLASSPSPAMSIPTTGRPYGITDRQVPLGLQPPPVSHISDSIPITSGRCSGRLYRRCDRRPSVDLF